MISAIRNGILKANADRNVEAVLVYGKGRTFPAGADISEFAKKRAEGMLHVVTCYTSKRV